MSELDALIGQELNRPVDPTAQDLLTAARGQVHDLKAALFYGSCLRDGLATDAVADLYLLVGDYRRSGQSWLAAKANRGLPPNVIYLEAETRIGRVAAKAAILTLDQFVRLTSDQTFHSYFWARFTQPAATIWAEDDRVRARIAAAMATAARTFAAECAGGALASDGSRDFWISGFARTYASELRAEGPERAETLYAADRARYDAIYAALRDDPPPARSSVGRWRRRRWLGKLLSVLRLAKAVFTFEGGVDYILWKIARHSGVRVEAKPWQRRWPLLAAPGLAFSIWRKGGFR